MNTVVISVRGEHTIREVAELAISNITLEATDSERTKALEKLAQVANPIRTDLANKADNGEIADWTNSQTSVWTEKPWHEGKEQAPIYHASTSLTATFSNPEILSLWLSEIAKVEGVGINWTEWKLTDETLKTLEAKAATTAVEVATQRAEAYAAALNLNNIVVKQLADVGLLSSGSVHAPVAEARLMRASADAMGGGPNLNITPSEITVSATVDMQFEAS